MSRHTATHWLVGWIGLVVIAVANGAFRTAVLEPLTGEGTAHVLSTLILLALITVMARLLHHRYPLASDGAALVMGLVWAALTVAFEFGLGAATGATWDEMMGQYAISHGKIWVLVPLWLILVPTVARKLGASDVSRHPDAITAPRPRPSRR